MSNVRIWSMIYHLFKTMYYLFGSWINCVIRLLLNDFILTTISSFRPINEVFVLNRAFTKSKCHQIHKRKEIKIIEGSLNECVIFIYILLLNAWNHLQNGSCMCTFYLINYTKYNRIKSKKYSKWVLNLFHSENCHTFTVDPWWNW